MAEKKKTFWEKTKDLAKWVWFWEMEDDDCKCGKKMSRLLKDDWAIVYQCRCGILKRVYDSGHVDWGTCVSSKME
jgi:hypothetical protein